MLSIKEFHKLIIEDISIEDGEEYSCVAGDVSTSAKLTLEDEDIVFFYVVNEIVMIHHL